MIPDVGDYMVLPWDEGKMIYHGADGYWLMSNVCRHRQAQILSGKGNAPVIVCNIHGWTYSSDGSLLGAPHFEETGGCDGLNRIQLLNCSGFLFTKVEGLEESVFDGFKPNTENFIFHSQEVVDYDFNWKAFMETYGEDYHVDPFHPGLKGFVDTGSLTWFNSKAFHYCSLKQVEGNHQKYQAYQDLLNESRLSGSRDFLGEVVWFMFYPNVMVEFYPGATVVVTIRPITPDKCRMYVDYFFHDEDVAFNEEFINAFKQAYNSTAEEDDEICKRMHEGRRSLFMNDQEDPGLFQKRLENGTIEFHKFYKERMIEPTHQRREIPIRPF